MPSQNLQGIETQAKTRLLLALWDLGGIENKVKRRDLNDRIGRKKDNAGDYDKAYQQLEKDGAIAIITNKRAVSVSLTEKGLQRLSQGLTSPEFEFSSQIGAKTANALLKWMRHIGTTVNGATASVEKADKGVIASYDEFKQVALEVYDQLNRDYNLNDLVPIYRIRREVGDRLSHDHFNKWLLEMQEKDILQLIAGEIPDMTSDKRENSITIPGAGLRSYAKRLS